MILFSQSGIVAEEWKHCAGGSQEGGQNTHKTKNQMKGGGETTLKVEPYGGKMVSSSEMEKGDAGLHNAPRAA